MKYFTIAELTYSATADLCGIENNPPQQAIKNLTALVDNVLDPLRESWGAPIFVNSGYRSAELNRKIGGAKKSQHLLGQAADIRTMQNTRQENRRLFYYIIRMKLPYDQLICENNFQWIHVSYRPKPRRQVLYI